MQFFIFIFAKSDLAGLTAPALIGRNQGVRKGKKNNNPLSALLSNWIQLRNCPAENKLKMNDFTLKSPISQLVQFFFLAGNKVNQ